MYWVIHTLLFVFSSGLSLGMRRGEKRVSAADERDRLLGLRHTKYITQRALVNVVEDLQRNGPLHNSSRATQYRARQALAYSETPYGRMIEVHEANGMTFGISPPFAAMHYHARNSASYASILKDTLRRAPGDARQPWSWILYQDGVDPSDGLSKTHTRKSTVFYWSIKEFGYDVLGQEQVWLTANVTRTRVLANIEGEHALIATKILETMYNDTHDGERIGVTLDLHTGETIHVYIKVGALLADVPAIKEIISSKGHSGMKCCSICANAVLESPPGGLDSLAEHSTWLKSIREPRLEALAFNLLAQYSAFMIIIIIMSHESINHEHELHFSHAKLRILSSYLIICDFGICTIHRRVIARSCC